MLFYVSYIREILKYRKSNIWPDLLLLLLLNGSGSINFDPKTTCTAIMVFHISFYKANFIGIIQENTTHFIIYGT